MVVVGTGSLATGVDRCLSLVVVFINASFTMVSGRQSVADVGGWWWSVMVVATRPLLVAVGGWWWSVMVVAKVY